jgi:uncharacterized membrane protein
VSPGSPDWRSYVDFLNNIVVGGLVQVAIVSLEYLEQQARWMFIFLVFFFFFLHIFFLFIVILFPNIPTVSFRAWHRWLNQAVSVQVDPRNIARLSLLPMLTVQLDVVGTAVVFLPDLRLVPNTHNDPTKWVTVMAP